MNDKRPKRKHLAHGILLIDSQPTILFDTVCTKNKELWLATSEAARLGSPPRRIAIPITPNAASRSLGRFQRAHGLIERI
jgi:hypothetical protein